jgi:hypothetical protein
VGWQRNDSQSVLLASATMAKSRKKRKSESAAASHQQTPQPTIQKNTEAKETMASGSEAANSRKRKHSSIGETKSQKSTDRAIFNGLMLAISTLESKTNQDTTEEEVDYYNNFKTLSNILKTNGATISPQVHKRVNYLVCTEQALNNLTQRVRQALKRNVDIIDVDWVKTCVVERRRIDANEYLLNDLAKELMDTKEKEKANCKNNASEVIHKDGYESDLPDENAAGWSEPIELDCCCVCHENGDENCPWCTECNINLAKNK